MAVTNGVLAGHETMYIQNAPGEAKAALRAAVGQGNLLTQVDYCREQNRLGWSGWNRGWVGGMSKAEEMASSMGDLCLMLSPSWPPKMILLLFLSPFILTQTLSIKIPCSDSGIYVQMHVFMTYNAPSLPFC